MPPNSESICDSYYEFAIEDINGDMEQIKQIHGKMMKKVGKVDDLQLKQIRKSIEDCLNAEFQGALFFYTAKFNWMPLQVDYVRELWFDFIEAFREFV